MAEVRPKGADFSVGEHIYSETDPGVIQGKVVGYGMTAGQLHYEIELPTGARATVLRYQARPLLRRAEPGMPEANPPAVLLVAVPEEKIPPDHEMLLHFGIEEVGSPGIVLDEARARASPCSCFTYKSKDLCWSKGIIGLLTQPQQSVYCVAGKTYKAQPRLVERYTRFAEAAEEAHKKIEAMPKGKERLEVWLTEMGKELSKRGIEV